MNTPQMCNMAKRHSDDFVVITGGMGRYAQKEVISALQDNNSFVKHKLQDDNDNVDVISQCSGFSYEEESADEAFRIKDDRFKQLSFTEKFEMWVKATKKHFGETNLKRESEEKRSSMDIALHAVGMEDAQETETIPLTKPGQDTRPAQKETDLQCDAEPYQPTPDSERFTLSKVIDPDRDVQMSQNGIDNKDAATFIGENDALETSSNMFRKSTNLTETTTVDLSRTEQDTVNITHGTQNQHMSDTPTCLENKDNHICNDVHVMLLKNSSNLQEFVSRQSPKQIRFAGFVEKSHSETWPKGMLKSEDMCVSDNAKSPVVDLQLTEKQTSSIRFAESVIDDYSKSRLIPSSESSQLCVRPVYGLPVSINMHSEMSRLATFSTAPTLAVSTIRLANSGFYYEEESDEIVCFSCGLQKREWREKENVHLVHFHLSQGCDHANKVILQQNTPSTVNGQPAHSQSSSADGAHTMTTDGESTDTRGSMAQRSWSETARQRFQGDHVDDSFNTELSDMTRMNENHLLLAGSRQPPQENSVAAEYRNNLFTTNDISVINGEPQLQTDCFQNGASLSSVRPSAKNDTTSLHSSFANGDSVEEGKTQRRQSAAKSTEQTRSRNNSTHISQNRNSSSFASMLTRNAVSSSTGSPLDGKSLALPTPAGRADQLQRHRQLAAQSAGTARPDRLDSSYPIVNGKSVTNPTTAGPSDKKQMGVHNTEAAHTGTCSDVPVLDHFSPSVQAHLSAISLQSPQAVPATILVNYSVPVVQAPDANPFQRGSSNALRQNEDNEDGAGEVPGDGLLDMRRAASPENALVSVRLATFLDWPTRGLPNRRLLVIAGFYYMGTGDSVRCFYCGVTLRNWRENDDPWVTHVRFRFSCDYVKAIKGEDFVYRALLQVALGHAISSETGCITSSESAAVTNGIDNSSTSCSSQQTSPTSIANTASAYAANSNAASDNTTAASGTTVPPTAARSSTTVGMSKEAPRGPGSCSTTEQGSENSASRSDMNAEGNRDQATLRSRDASEGASTSSTENGPDAMGTGKKGKGNKKGGASKAAANTDGASVGTYAQNGVEVLQTDAEPDKHRSTASLPRTNQQTVAVGGQSPTFQSTISTEYVTVPNVGVAGNHGDATSFEQLQETNHRLRRRVTCRLCGNRPVDTIFLPCGHLCTCETCAATIRMCCLCNDRIRGTAHVYME